MWRLYTKDIQTAITVHPFTFHSETFIALVTAGLKESLLLSCKDYVGWINAALNIMSNLFTWCIKEHIWQIHATLYRNKTSEDSNPCDKSPLFWQLRCKWWVKSSWHAWVSPPGHSPLGSSTSFVSGVGRQECASNVRMNKCSSVTFPHVKEEGVLSRSQLDSPNWGFDHTHLHMSHSAAASCMFHRNGG